MNFYHSNFPSRIVYNCIDGDKFKPSGEKDKHLVLTVGAVKKETWTRKGICRFTELAKMMPDFEFVVVGKIHDDMKINIMNAKMMSPNLTFTGFASNEELLKWYQKAKVYCQR